MKNQLLYIGFMFTILISGCKKFVEIGLPKSLVVTAAVFQDNNTATTALTGIYYQMHDIGQLPLKLSAFTGLYSDEIYSRFGLYTNLYQNALSGVNASANFTNDFWNACYSYIYQANAVYEGCDHSDKLTPAVKIQLMAEARFIRALCNFYLVNLYGDIPLVLSTSYQTNAVLARTNKDLVYNQIIADLQYAQSYLNENYVGANSENTITDRVRPNRATATAFLARVYLYMGNYEAAEIQSNSVISNTNYTLETIPNVFLKTSKEAIWQLMKSTPISSVMTYEGQFYILSAVPVTNNTIQSSTIEPSLLNAFEANDLRRSNWVGKASGGNYYYPYKFKVQVTTATVATEYTQPLRLAEQYLIRAEARIQLNRTAEGIADLNALRARATDTSAPLSQRLPQLSTSLSKDAALTAVLHERQVELFTEWGHRWLDLKRTGKVEAVMATVTPTKGGIWQSYKQLWPIPDKELATDVNLKQNEGYN